VGRYVKGGLSRSLTVRNLQLSLYGLPFSMAYMWLKDGIMRSNMVQVGLRLIQGQLSPTPCRLLALQTCLSYPCLSCILVLLECAVNSAPATYTMTLASLPAGF
jgi:hypothetical protein